MSSFVIPFLITWFINGTSVSCGDFDFLFTGVATISDNDVFLQYLHLISRRHSCLVDARIDMSCIEYNFLQEGHGDVFLICLIIAVSSLMFMFELYSSFL